MAYLKNMYDWPWEVGMLPFVYTPLESSTNVDNLPDFLPFLLNIDRKTGALIQVYSESVQLALAKVYVKGSMISGMMDDSGIGRQYAEDFLSFMRHSLRTERFDSMRVLEIGCGTGYLLYRMKLLGGDVLGVEPGSHSQKGVRRYNVPIINDFFPSSKIDSKFDLIILYGVLEHIESPINFISSLTKYLTHKGEILLSVPNCEPYMKVGDISMLLHEHVNYFTETSLRNTFLKAIEFDVSIQKSSFGCSLYAIAKPTKSGTALSQFAIEQEILNISKFRYLVEKGIRKIEDYLCDALNKKESVAIYVPGRIINTLSLIRDKLVLLKLRFFDDNVLLHGTFFPGFNIPVEPREKLINIPTNRVLIMSHSFGSKIAKQLKFILNKNVRITTWEELYSQC